MKYSPEQIANKWKSIKKVREELMLSTDYTQMPDTPITDESKAEFATYRQILRDLPNVNSDPFNVRFPFLPKYIKKS